MLTDNKTAKCNKPDWSTFYSLSAMSISDDWSTKNEEGEWKEVRVNVYFIFFYILTSSVGLLAFVYEED